MGRTKTQKSVSQKQSTISKFFGVSESKSSKRNAAEVANNSSDQPAKFAKLESSTTAAPQKEISLLDSTIDKIKQFSYQEEAQPRNRSEACSQPSTVVGAAPNFNIHDIVDRTDPSDVCHMSEDEDEDTTNTMEDNSKHKHDDASKKTKFTPLEQQYLDFKKTYPDAILFIECGYKYRLFGEDAQVASKILNIGCFVSHNFHSSSIPTHRLSVHVQRLVFSGHKVGVVKQTETAALKAASDNKNTLFSRKLHALYTASTLIGEDFNTLNDQISETNHENHQVSPLLGYLACIYDIPSSSEKTNIVNIGIMAVNPTSGDVLYASFDDTVSRSELESYLTQINPIEIILPESTLTSGTENLIKNFCEISSIINRKIRIEKLPNSLFEYTHALNHVSEFFESSDMMADMPPTNDNCKEVLSTVLSLPPAVICCVSSLISYLAEFHLEILLKNWRQWQSLTSSSMSMALNAAAVRNLEILQNSSDGTVYGSLLWTLNFARTKFGNKLLKSWLTKPLKDHKRIEERLDIVTEVVKSQSSSVWSKIEKFLTKLPDLEKLLCAAFYHRCTCSEFMILISTLVEVKKELGLISEILNMEVQESKVKEMILQAISLLQNVESFSKNINEKAASEEDKTKLFIDTSKYSAVVQCEADIKQAEMKLNDLKKDICRTLHIFSFNYSTVMGQQYLIEVKNSNLSLVPSSWMKISSTKQVSRFRSREVEMYFNELRQLLEKLKQHCNEAWNSFLDEFGSYFYKYKQVVSYLAQLDCIITFAKFGKQEGFCRPILTDSEHRELNIIQGRNPIVAKLIEEKCQYVANDTKFNGNQRCMIITGPNMGGKSSYVRQVALIAILAQVGSYVPAEHAELPVFDGIYVRMGADDDVVGKRSTFFTEMMEASGILSKASSQSLVILDELGRGTSTHDGSAIAHATLNYLVDQVTCMTLFVTHYPLIVNQIHSAYPENVLCCHLAFWMDSNAQDDTSETPDVTFLYTVTPGIASKSYGINVARLAGIESEILTKAAIKSSEFEGCVKRRFMHSIVKGIMTGNVDELRKARAQMMKD